MKRKPPSVIRLSGIEVAEDRYQSINGPAVCTMPDWGLSIETEGVEYHLHPAITYEVHYQLPFYLLVHTFNGAQGRFGLGDFPLGDWVADAYGTCLIPPNMRVRIIQDTPLEFIALGVKPDFFERIAGDSTPVWRDMDALFKTTDPALAALFAEMRRSMIAEPVGNEAYLDSLTEAMLMRFKSWHITPDAEAHDGAETLSPGTVRRLSRLIEEQLEESLRVTDLAEEAGLSRSHFSRAFTHAFGVSPQNYIMSRRIARARSMLTDTPLSATEIAYACGFSNPSHLTTAFKQEMGLTPTDYRKAMALTEGARAAE